MWGGATSVLEVYLPHELFKCVWANYKDSVWREAPTRPFDRVGLLGLSLNPEPSAGDPRRDERAIAPLSDRDFWATGPLLVFLLDIEPLNTCHGKVIQTVGQHEERVFWELVWPNLPFVLICSLEGSLWRQLHRRHWIHESNGERQAPDQGELEDISFCHLLINEKRKVVRSLGHGQPRLQLEQLASRFHTRSCRCHALITTTSAVFAVAKADQDSISSRRRSKRSVR